MADPKELEMRIVQLENQLAELRGAKAADITTEELATFLKVKDIIKTIFECGGCGPCACDTVSVLTPMITQAVLAQLQRFRCINECGPGLPGIGGIAGGAGRFTGLGG